MYIYICIYISIYIYVYIYMCIYIYIYIYNTMQVCTYIMTKLSYTYLPTSDLILTFVTKKANSHLPFTKSSAKFRIRHNCYT